MRFSGLFVMFLFFINQTFAQLNEEQIGGWYGYFAEHKFKESKFGVEGDVAYRNWNIIGDLEQFLIRGAAYYMPKNKSFKIATGYAFFVNGAPGESDETVSEHRLHQDFILPHKLGNRLYLSHRFRLEERWIQEQDFRHRYRYTLFLDIPLNNKELKPKTVYTSLFNEVFINGQTSIGNGREVDKFDRNWLFGGVGYVFSKSLRIRFGLMNQYTPSNTKNQWLLTLHQKL